MKILIAEDNSSIKDLLEKMLRKWNYDTVSTESCEEAFDLFQKDKFRFLILDWNMPGRMQGIDLARKIRSMNLSNYIYIAMLTGRNDREDFKTGVKVGVDDYIIKPFQAAELKLRIIMGERIIKLKQEIMDLKREPSSNETKAEKEPDPLNGNKEKVLLKLDKIIEKCNQKSIPLGIVSLNCKNLGDTKITYGKMAFNSMNLEMLSRIKPLCPKNSLVERMDSHQYVIAIPNCSAQTCEALKKSIHEALISRSFEMEIRVSSSFNSDIKCVNTGIDKINDSVELMEKYL